MPVTVCLLEKAIEIGTLLFTYGPFVCGIQMCISLFSGVILCDLPVFNTVLRRIQSMTIIRLFLFVFLCDVS